MANLAATRVQAKEAAPSANYKGVANKGCSSHAPKCATPPPALMGWIGCTTNWRKSTPSPLCKWVG
jgi:hypothetical protein